MKFRLSLANIWCLMLRLSVYLSELRPTLTLAAPIIVGQMSQMLLGVIDSIMIGHAGTVPLAASGFGASVFNIFYVLGIGLMIPTAIFVSRARGAGDPREAGEYLRHGLLLAVAFGILETLAMFALSLQLQRFGQPPEVEAIVRPFFLLLAGSLIPVLVYLVLREFAEAMGHPWAPMFIMLGCVALNAGLNWILIYGNWGAPAMGLTGAGIATLISRIIAAFAIFAWLSRDAKVRAAWPSRWLGAWSGVRLREMLHVGLPAAGMLLFECSAFAISSIMNGWLGAVPLAAHQIAISAASLAFMLPLGLAMANGMRVSHAVGAGDFARVRPIALSTLAAGLCGMTVFALAFGFGGTRIATAFVEDPAVIHLAGQLLIVAALFQLVDGTQVIAASALRGITDVRVPAVITFVAYWVIALPLAYWIGVRGPWGAVGIWIGIASGLTFAAVFLTARFIRRTAAI